MATISPHIESIIILQLDQQASPAEQAVLEKWLSESAAHREAYQAVLRVWNESQVAALQHPFDTAAAWEKVSQRIQPQKANVFHLPRWKTALSAAAALVLIIGLPTLYYGRITAEPIAWKEVRAAGNQEVRLADGSRVSLRHGSVLQYPERFSGNSRAVSLQGEAYFEVLHDADRPFRINTRQSVVTDLGTAFLLRTTDSADQVVVTEGQVGLARKAQPRQQLILLPGEKGELSSSRLWKEAANTRNLLAWKKGILRFEQAPLAELTKDLEHYFGVRFVVAASVPAEKIRVTVQFNQQPLEEVLDELQLITGLSFVQRGPMVEVLP